MALLSAQRLPALGAARVDDLATGFGRHARAETVAPFAHEVRGLKGAFHRSVSMSADAPRGIAAHQVLFEARALICSRAQVKPSGRNITKDCNIFRRGSRQIVNLFQIPTLSDVCGGQSVTLDQAPVIALSKPAQNSHLPLELKPAPRKDRVMSDMTQDAKPGLMRNLPLIIILAVAVLGAFTLRDYLSFDALRDNREALIAFRDGHYLLTVLGFVIAYVVIVGFSLPGALIATLTGGFLFGTLAGSLFSVTGATLGATIIFLAARHGLGEKLKERMDASQGAINKIKKGLDENQWSMLFFIRLVPAVPFFVANLIPAFLAVPLYRFFVSTFLGIIPGSLVYSSVGAGLGEVFERGETPNFGLIFEPHILLPILGLSALSLLPVIVKAVTGKKDLSK